MSSRRHHDNRALALDTRRTPPTTTPVEETTTSGLSGMQLRGSINSTMGGCLLRVRVIQYYSYLRFCRVSPKQHVQREKTGGAQAPGGNEGTQASGRPRQTLPVVRCKKTRTCISCGSSGTIRVSTTATSKARSCWSRKDKERNDNKKTSAFWIRKNRSSP